MLPPIVGIDRVKEVSKCLLDWPALKGQFAIDCPDELVSSGLQITAETIPWLSKLDVSGVYRHDVVDSTDRLGPCTGIAEQVAKVDAGERLTLTVFGPDPIHAEAIGSDLLGIGERLRHGFVAVRDVIADQADSLRRGWQEWVC